MESDYQSSDQSFEDTNTWNEHNISLFDHQYCSVNKEKIKMNPKHSPDYEVKICQNKNNTQKTDVNVEVIQLSDKTQDSYMEEDENYSILTIEQFIKNTDGENSDLKLKENNKRTDSQEIIGKHEIINKILDDQQKVEDCQEIDYIHYVENDICNQNLNEHNKVTGNEDSNFEDNTLKFNMKEIFKKLCEVPTPKQQNMSLYNCLSGDTSSHVTDPIYEDFDLSLENRIFENGDIIQHTNHINFKSHSAFDKEFQPIKCGDVNNTGNKKCALNDSEDSTIYEIVCNDLSLNEDLVTNIELDLLDDENEDQSSQDSNNDIIQNSTDKKKLTKSVKRKTRQHLNQENSAVLKTINTTVEPQEENSFDSTYNDYSNLRGKNRIESIKSLSFDDCIEGLINDVKKVEKRRGKKETVQNKIHKQILVKKPLIESNNKNNINVDSKLLNCNICLVSISDHIGLLNHLTECHLEDVNMDCINTDDYDIENHNEIVPINISEKFSLDNVINMEESENNIDDLPDVNANLSIKSQDDKPFPQATYFCCICQSIFKEKYNYDRHLKEVHILDDDKYFCYICNKTFKYKGRLRVHLSSKHEDYKPKSFSDSRPVLNDTTNVHESISTNELSDTLQSQLLKVKAYKKRRYHLNKNKSIKPNKIFELKSKIFGNEEKLIKNSIVHTFEDIPETKNLTYSCLKCKVKFNSKEKLILHNKSKHRTMKLHHVCLKCGDHFESYLKLVHHIKSEHNINLFQRYKCNLCPIVYKNEDKLTQHYKLKHKTVIEKVNESDVDRKHSVSFLESMHSCSICQSMFTSKEMLGRHIESEHIFSKDVKHKCDQCGQVTSTC